MSTLSVRRPLSLLAVLAMVATMLFAVVGTASAAIAKPANLSSYSGCPANAGIPDGGFTDVPAGTFFNDSVSCLKYYEVTTGVTPTTYEPATDVTRVQMALFLARSAAASGVVLKASPPSAGFTDIGALSAEAQLAINQLADAGIVKGKTATTYGPTQTVWRQQMALFLTRFLGKAVVGPGGTALTGATKTGSPFTDIGQTTVEASQAINQAWDLGIGTGTTDTTFNPLGNVNRGQMSLFMTRLWGHTNTRPAGVNIQATPLTGFGTFSTDLSVTVRGTDFLPSANTEVDVWRFNPVTGVTSPFNANGTCNTASGTIIQLQSGGLPCTLDLIDSTMDLNGNWPVFPQNATDGATSSFYAWTGAVGSTFDNDTTTHSTVTIGSSKAASNATVKDDLPKYASEAKFGTTVTLTVQLMDGTGSTAKPVAKSGVPYTFADTKTVNGAAAGVIITVIKTDAAGKATYQVTQSDPGASPSNDDAKNVIVVTGTPLAIGSAITIDWNDDAAAAATVVAATATEYKVQSNGASNMATATLYDQYGNPMPGKVINFTSDMANGVGGTIIPRTTNAAGVAILGYTWNHSGSTDDTAVEEIEADAGGTVPVSTTDFYWVDAATDGATVAATGIAALVVDVANDKVVGLDTEYKVWTWAAGDQFNVSASASTQAAFETEIAKTGAMFEVSAYFGTTAGTSAFNAHP